MPMIVRKAMLFVFACSCSLAQADYDSLFPAEDGSAHHISGGIIADNFIAASTNFYEVETDFPTMGVDRGQACMLAKQKLRQRCGLGKIVGASCDCNFNGNHWVCNATGECADKE